MSVLKHCGAAALIAAAALAVGCADEPPVGPETSAVTAPSFSGAADLQALRQHIVVLAEQASPSQDFLARLRELGGSVDRTLGQIGVVTVSGLTDAAAAELSGRADVEGINQDVLVQWLPPSEEILGDVIQVPAAESNQSGSYWFPIQWNIRQIRADDAWLATRACEIEEGLGVGSGVAGAKWL